LRVFVDSHAWTEVGPDALLQALFATEAPLPHRDQAHPIDYLVASGGRIICIAVGADEKAIKRLHEQLGLPCATVTAIDGADGVSPLSDNDRDLALRAIGGSY
jgi:hypothetical protein